MEEAGCLTRSLAVTHAMRDVPRGRAHVRSDVSEHGRVPRTDNDESDAAPQPTLTDLPDECLHTIFRRLGALRLTRVALVCRRLRDATLAHPKADRAVWRPLVARRFGTVVAFHTTFARDPEYALVGPRCVPRDDLPEQQAGHRSEADLAQCSDLAWLANVDVEAAPGVRSCDVDEALHDVEPERASWRETCVRGRGATMRASAIVRACAGSRSTNTPLHNNNTNAHQTRRYARYALVAREVADEASADGHIGQLMQVAQNRLVHLTPMEACVACEELARLAKERRELASYFVALHARIALNQLERVKLHPHGDASRQSHDWDAPGICTAVALLSAQASVAPVPAENPLLALTRASRAEAVLAAARRAVAVRLERLRTTGRSAQLEVLFSIMHGCEPHAWHVNVRTDAAEMDELGTAEDEVLSGPSSRSDVERHATFWRLRVMRWTKSGTGVPPELWDPLSMSIVLDLPARVDLNTTLSLPFAIDASPTDAFVTGIASAPMLVLLWCSLGRSAGLPCEPVEIAAEHVLGCCTCDPDGEEEAGELLYYMTTTSAELGIVSIEDVDARLRMHYRHQRINVGGVELRETIRRIGPAAMACHVAGVVADASHQSMQALALVGHWGTMAMMRHATNLASAYETISVLRIDGTEDSARMANWAGILDNLGYYL